jgi:hypothetical protein
VPLGWNFINFTFSALLAPVFAWALRSPAVRRAATGVEPT